jgi:hypothetical protein
LIANTNHLLFDVYFNSHKSEEWVSVGLMNLYKVIVYIRFSTLTQTKEGESLEAQRSQVTSYAASKGLSLTDGVISFFRS